MLTDKQIEREEAFCEDWYMTRKMEKTPTYADAIAWADKTMIEKACEYLRQSLYNTPIFEHDEDETPVNYVCASCCDSVEEFIENFRRAMEE